MEVKVEVAAPLWTQLIQAPPSHTWLPVDTHKYPHKQSVSASGGLTSKKKNKNKPERSDAVNNGLQTCLLVALQRQTGQLSDEQTARQAGRQTDRQADVSLTFSGRAFTSSLWAMGLMDSWWMISLRTSSQGSTWPTPGT